MSDDITRRLKEIDEQLPPRRPVATLSVTLGVVGALLSILTDSTGWLVFFTAGILVAVLQYRYATRVLNDE